MPGVSTQIIVLFTFIFHANFEREWGEMCHPHATEKLWLKVILKIYPCWLPTLSPDMWHAKKSKFSPVWRHQRPAIKHPKFKLKLFNDTPKSGSYRRKQSKSIIIKSGAVPAKLNIKRYFCHCFHTRQSSSEITTCYYSSTLTTTNTQKQHFSAILRTRTNKVLR